jgi:serine/threonine protein kinase
MLAKAPEQASVPEESPTLNADLEPSGSSLQDVAPIQECEGSTIGNYRLLQRIGEGGMGVVYLSDQEHPVQRRVALKIVKLGMDTEAVVARFEAERQALAMMDHPNIARVLDAGATSTGRPYFVMELVQGIPITESIGWLTKKRVRSWVLHNLESDDRMSRQSGYEAQGPFGSIRPAPVAVSPR